MHAQNAAIPRPVTRRKHRTLLVVFCLLLILFSVPAWLTYREVQQQHRNRALLAAIKRDDTQTVLLLLAQGADPNARDNRHSHPSFWQHAIQLFDRRKTTLPNTAPTP